MNTRQAPLRVLYSFPHKIGAGRICTTAWEQVKGVAGAGAEVHAFVGAVGTPLPQAVNTRPTLARGKLRIPYRLIGDMRACGWHDYIVARRLRKMAGQVDIVHTWPLGALRTLETASRLGIPTVLERPNAHTRFAFEVVQAECARIGVPLPPNHEHAYNSEVLRVEEEEYRRAYRLLCPSEFTANSFVQRGFSPDKLARHFYGLDPNVYNTLNRRSGQRPFTAVFVGVCAVRKGLHYALAAWLASPAHRAGIFQIAGEFLPAYQEKLAPMLAHPSIRVLGHRTDIAELMRNSDILVLPTIEEGFALVCTEAMASGCVPVVSNACTELCKHMENALVHEVGDVAALTRHITTLYENPGQLTDLREAGILRSQELTWAAAGERLLELYRTAVNRYTCEQGQRQDTAAASATSVRMRVGLKES